MSGQRLGHHVSNQLHILQKNIPTLSNICRRKKIKNDSRLGSICETTHPTQYVPNEIYWQGSITCTKRKRYVIQIRNKFVDAEGQRGRHKYVNHCCDGGGAENYQRSARLHLWSDQNGIAHVSIVTNRQVEKGEELLVNYGGDYVIGDCRCPNCSNDDRQTRGTQTQQRNESET